MKQGETIAVIGAGLAGALVAQGLKRRGARVTLFDKSRGTGGRLAAARLGELSVDLGAPGLNNLQFRALQDLLQGSEQPELACWQPQAADFDLQPTTGPELWLATPRSSGLTRSLLTGIELATQVRIARVEYGAGSGVWLEDDTGQLQGEYDRVVIATPAPQAASLLQAEPELQHAVREMDMAPAWILLLALEQRPGRLARIDWLEGEHPLFRRIWRDGSKPGREGETWAIEARPDWSRTHVGEPPEQVQSMLLQAFSELCRQELQPLRQRIHRWLYAHADESELQTFCSRDARLLLCGDWVCGGGIDAAIRSAQQLLQRLDA